MSHDPTYVKAEIDANPAWKLAWRLSEVDNDNAPIGWSRYIPLASWLFITFDMTEKPEPLPGETERMTCQCCQGADRLTAQVRGVELCDECASFMRSRLQTADSQSTAAHALIAQWRSDASAHDGENYVLNDGARYGTRHCADQLEALLTPQEAR